MDHECKELLKEIRDLLKVNNSKLDDINSELSSIYSNIPSSSNYDEVNLTNCINDVELKILDVYELLCERLVEEE